LPQIVTALRETILAAGGEVRFNTKVTDLLIRNGEIKGVITHDGATVEGIGVILATGHSARDIFELLHQRQVCIEAKPFAMGVRIEHPQSLIDHLQYHRPERGDYLPAAAYSLVNQVKFQGVERGVFSFCMCPGGFHCSRGYGSGRSSSQWHVAFAPRFALRQLGNGGRHPPRRPPALPAVRSFAGLQMQRELEQKACEAAGGSQVAPAQRMLDFVNRKISSDLLPTSYQPGLASVDMSTVLPAPMTHRLREGFKVFGQKMRGYLTNEAQLIGVESRTSSPVRIPRDKETLDTRLWRGFFPAAKVPVMPVALCQRRWTANVAPKKWEKKYGKAIF
jgi:uncharacterized FAD-dependent dehydrogenase